MVIVNVKFLAIDILAKFFTSEDNSTVGQNGDFADIRGYLKGTKCCRGSWQLVLTYERDKSNGSQKALKLLYSGGLIL